MVETIQDIIDEMKKIQALSYRERYDMDRTELYRTDKAEQLYMLSAIYSLSDRLPLDIDSTPLDIMGADNCPIIYSYEKIKDGLHILWDSYHNLDMTILSNKDHLIDCNMEVPNRVSIFNKGIEKINPAFLGLELTRDTGQEIVNKYMNFEMSDSEARDRINDNHMSTSFDDYTPILRHCKKMGIEVRCIAPTMETYMSSGRATPKLKELWKKSEECEDKVDRAEIDFEHLIETSKYHDTFIAPEVLKMHKEGSTLLIIGAGHRNNLPELLKK